MTDPFKIFSEGMQMWTGVARQAQQNWTQMLARQTEWAKENSTLFPLQSADMAMDEAKIREVFQRAADMNLHRWTEMAEKIAALPSWVRWPSEVPGRALTDMFDMMRPFPVFETNQTPAPNAAQRLKQLTIEQKDDLTEIKGIGPKIAEKLDTLGIFRFAQIADWNETDALKADIVLSLGRRIERQNWVAQAKRLAKPVLH